MKHCPDFGLGPSLPIPDSSSIGLKYKTASLLSHVLKSWLECLLHENDEVKILQRDPLEWLECNFIRPSVPSLLLLPHFYDCHMIPSSHQMIFALGPILAMAEKPPPSIGRVTFLLLEQPTCSSSPQYSKNLKN